MAIIAEARHFFFHEVTRSFAVVVCTEPRSTSVAVFSVTTLFFKTFDFGVITSFRNCVPFHVRCKYSSIVWKYFCVLIGDEDAVSIVGTWFCASGLSDVCNGVISLRCPVAIGTIIHTRSLSSRCRMRVPIFYVKIRVLPRFFHECAVVCWPL